MTVQSDPASSMFDRPVSCELQELIETTTKGLQQGLSLDIQQLIADHPMFADQLRELLPAIEMLVRLGNGQSRSSTAASHNYHGLLPLGSQLGDFRLVREIGRGGMG